MNAAAKVMNPIWLLVLMAACLASCSKAPQVPVSKGTSAAPVVPAIVGRVEAAQVIAYYFHGDIRCATCLKIEKQAKELIEQRFLVEMAEKRLLFRPVNYDKPENAHFSKDYKLPCPSLVLVRQQGGKDEQWKLLDKTWDHVENPIKFNEYVEGSVKEMLSK
jgi:hypothetical protein